MRDTIRPETVVGQGPDTFNLVGQEIDEDTKKQLEKLLPDTEIPKVATEEFLEAVLKKLTKLKEADLAKLFTGNNESTIASMKGLVDGASSFVDFTKKLLNEFLQKQAENSDKD